MMRVRTYVAESRIPGAGLGVFCATAITAGQILWRFDPGLDVEIDRLPEDPSIAAFLHRYSYVPRLGAERWILCVDDARFYNHADDPNSVGDEWISYAAIDIPADSELTVDYRSFDRRPLVFWL
jgi:uncharacterized protein